MAATVYLLCALTSLFCALLLTRGFRRTHVRLLFWSAACFLMIGVSNSLLFFDLIVFPQVNLLTYRNSITLVAMGLQIYGLVFESE
jgi:hypothetical protein